MSKINGNTNYRREVRTMDERRLAIVSCQALDNFATLAKGKSRLECLVIVATFIHAAQGLDGIADGEMDSMMRIIRQELKKRVKMQIEGVPIIVS